MKKWSILIGFILSIQFSNAQTVNNHNSLQLEAYDVSGKPLTSIPQNAEGHPFLNENWGKGLVRLRNGYWIKSIDLQFNLYENQLYFRKNNNVFLFTDTVSEFVISFNVDAENTATGHYKSGYPAIEKKNAETFYEILAEGQQVHLLKHKYKTMFEKNAIGEAKRMVYKEGENYFLYLPATNKIIRIRLSASSLKEALPEKAAAIDAFMAEKKYKLKNEDQVTALIVYLNQ
ncbi:MAG: hypothetical protein K2P88_10610 [Chitinophagaceae bacterium]|uniref:hypothetical protein n=1 Tax=unclassified Paraflavitalea TaxID=2798305 RepID=UPI003D32F6A9|nr:hypothetical protein [Chitinophagaceae bacterium]